jgi:DNA-binding protein HU-beta
MAKPSSAMAKPKAAAPAKPAAAAKSAAHTKSASAKHEKVELVTLRQLADSVADGHGLSHKQAGEVLSSAIALMTGHLKKGARIRIAGLGTFEVRKRAARMGRNPATGAAIQIKASKKVAFRAAKDLSEAV